MPLAHDGYAWWYIDALSDDGIYGLTVIAFVGSVFSPYYAWARRQGPTDPLNHCAINVALYGTRAQRWSMTERAADTVSREATQLSIGPSCIRWDGDVLAITIDEVTAPLPRRLRGTIRLRPEIMLGRSFALDTAGRHRWTPFAPRARIELEFREPALGWAGNAYFDSNSGEEPLETAFTRWTWSRTAGPHETRVLYDVEGIDSAHTLALRFGRDGGVREFEPPSRVELPGTAWRLPRHTRADAGSEPRLVNTLEDAPFYNRSVLHSVVQGIHAPAIHESLDLRRFSAPWVQCLLPFRMPRLWF